MEINKIINDIFRIVLNIILITIAVSCSVQVFTIFNKKYRYVGTSLLLLLMLVVYLFHYCPLKVANSSLK